MGLHSLTEIGEETILLSYGMVYDHRSVIFKEASHDLP